MSDVYINEVYMAHKEIERWLRGEVQSEALAPLLARFSKRFTMITPGGSVLDYEGLAAFFTQAFGKKPGLHIDIETCRMVASHGNIAVVHYQERQKDETTGQAAVRYATAAFEQDERQGISWLHLQETFAP